MLNLPLSNREIQHLNPREITYVATFNIAKRNILLFDREIIVVKNKIQTLGVAPRNLD